jgi:Serine carboxypeptidase
MIKLVAYTRTGKHPFTTTQRHININFTYFQKIHFFHSLYDDCTYSNGIKGNSKYNRRFQGGVNDYACGGDIVMVDYLNRPDVHAALNVKKADFFSVDNAGGDFDYTPSEPDLRPFYKEMNGKLRILVYNGGKKVLMQLIRTVIVQLANLFTVLSHVIELFTRH